MACLSHVLHKPEIGLVMSAPLAWISTTHVDIFLQQLVPACVGLCQPMLIPFLFDLESLIMVTQLLQLINLQSGLRDLAYITYSVVSSAWIINVILSGKNEA